MQMSYFTFNGKNYFASHAGFGFFNERDLKFIPSIDFIKGGKYEDDVDSWWEEKNYSTIQIHGHRNIFEYPVDKFKTSSGVYEFMLTYPSLSDTLYNRWTQTSSPNAGTVTGFTPITTAWSGHNAGIRKKSG